MRRERAMALFEEGYNCAQSVFLAFSDLHGMDTHMAAALSSSFGGGMGRLREVCGAVSGMFLVAEYYKKRPCKELVGDAAEILEKYIAEHPVG